MSVQPPPGFLPYFLRRPPGQQILRADAAVQTETVAVGVLQFPWVHPLRRRLQRVENIHANFDQILHQRTNGAAGVGGERTGNVGFPSSRRANRTAALPTAALPVHAIHDSLLLAVLDAKSVDDLPW